MVRLISDIGSQLRLAWHPNSEMLVSSTYNILTVWDVTTGEPVETIQTDLTAIQTIKWSPTGNFIATMTRGIGLVLINMEKIRAKEYQFQKTLIM